MTLNEYQEKAMSTCMYSCDNFSYMFLKLVGDVGKYASEVAKRIGTEQISIGSGESHQRNCLICIGPLSPVMKEFRDGLENVAGDILWQLAGLCRVMNISLEKIAQMNLDKLAGIFDGDNR